METKVEKKMRRLCEKVRKLERAKRGKKRGIKRKRNKAK